MSTATDMILHQQQEIVSNNARYTRTINDIAVWREQIDRVIQEAYPNMKARQKFYHDQRLHYKFLEVGDEAWLKNFKPRARGENKLNVRWRGPYRVVETFDKAPHTYRLQHKHQPEDIQVAHWSNLHFGSTLSRVGAETFYNCATGGEEPPNDDNEEQRAGRTVGGAKQPLVLPPPKAFKPVRGFDERSEHLSDLDIARGMDEEDEEEEDVAEPTVEAPRIRVQPAPSATKQWDRVQPAPPCAEGLEEPPATSLRRSGRQTQCPQRFGYAPASGQMPYYDERPRHVKKLGITPANHLIRSLSQTQQEQFRQIGCLAEAEQAERCATAQSL